jgi:hypothetical protein
MRTGELAYIQQIDLDEHMFYAHSALLNNMPAQLGPKDLVPAWSTNGFPLNPAGSFQADGEYWGNGMFAEDPSFQLNDEFDLSFEMDFSLVPDSPC